MFYNGVLSENEQTQENGWSHGDTRGYRGCVKEKKNRLSGRGSEMGNEKRGMTVQAKRVFKKAVTV